MAKKIQTKHVGELGSNFESMANIVAAMDGVDIIKQNLFQGELFVRMSSSCLEDFELKLEGAGFHQVGSNPQKYFISQKHRVEVFIAPHSTARYDEDFDARYRKVEIYQLGE